MGKDNNDRIRVPARIHNWILEENLGAGYSGSIWKATNPYTGQTAAVKVQDVDHECPTNRFERNFYPSLQGAKGMPTLWASGVQGDFDYLVIDLLGPSLDKLYRQNDRRFDLWTTICMAMQVIERLETMHNRGLLHRDIQLGNCVTGLGENAHIIYMIDFGFSKRYITNGKHIPDSKAKRDFIGNYWFSSVNVHCRGKVPSRRDDMEALALMLIHVLTDGGLPWTRNGVPKTDKQHDILIRKKLRTTPDELCQGLPPVFEDFLRYCRRLKFLDQPDYGLWMDRFADLAVEMGFYDSLEDVRDDFVWPPRPFEEKRHIHIPQTFTLAKVPMKENKISVEEILGELANLKLDEKATFALEWKASANKKEENKVVVVPKPKEKEKEPLLLGIPSNLPKSDSQKTSGSDGKKKKAGKKGTNVIVISSSDESEPFSHRLDRTSKQAAIRHLISEMQVAGNKRQLGLILHRLIKTLQANRSRVITKDALEFFTILSKQLSGLSTIVVKSGGPQTQKSDKSDSTESSEKSDRRLRSSRPTPPVAARGPAVVEELLGRVAFTLPSTDTSAFVPMIDEFVAYVRSSSNKSLTSIGALFLSELADRLMEVKRVIQI